MLRALRAIVSSLLVAALAAPAAQAASTVPAAPLVTTTPQPAPAPGSAFGPLPPPGAATTPTQTTINTRRPDEKGLGHGTLLLLVGVSFTLIIGVGFVIWYEGKTQRAVRKQRRKRLRSGRTPQPQTAGAEGRRGPPPPPRKRRTQAAKRKKR